MSSKYYSLEDKLEYYKYLKYEVLQNFEEMRISRFQRDLKIRSIENRIKKLVQRSRKIKVVRLKALERKKF